MPEQSKMDDTCHSNTDKKLEVNISAGDIISGHVAP
jgi:hypothetical protein